MFGSDDTAVKTLTAVCLGGPEAVYAVTRGKKDLVVKRVSSFLRESYRATATDAGVLLEPKQLEEGKVYLLWDPSDADTAPTIQLAPVPKEWATIQ